MTNISKRPLERRFSENLLEQLARALVKSGRKSSVAFLRSFFSEAEQVMFIKRLAVIALLREEYSEYKIYTLLKMSPSTVAKLHEQYLAGRYDSVLRSLGRSKKEKEEMWKIVELVLRAGMPSMGKDRWRWLDKHFGHNYPKHTRP